MKLKKVVELLDANILNECYSEDTEVLSACGCDLMSDVLAFVKDQAVLLTGLLNLQTVRTAMMMDMVCVVFVRSKAPTEEMLELARESGIVIMTTDKRMYDACGILYTNGLVSNRVKPI